MSSTTHGSTPYYYVPHPSRHPVMASIGLFFVILGAGQWVNGSGWGMYCLLFGLVWWLAVLYQWFKEAIAERRPLWPQDRPVLPLEHDLVHFF
jgi:cytochrome c oxidase subunit 3